MSQSFRRRKYFAACSICLFLGLLSWWELRDWRGVRQSQQWAPQIKTLRSRAGETKIGNQAQKKVVAKVEKKKKKNIKLCGTRDMLKPEVNEFFRDDTVSGMASYELIRLSAIVRAEQELCDGRYRECEDYRSFVETLAQGADDSSDARLRVIPIDPLAWLKSFDGDAYINSTREVAAQLNAARTYIRFRGSDYLFVCLTQSCQSFGEDFAKTLAENRGTRAILAGVNLAPSRLKWPCPHRLIQLQSDALDDKEQLVRAIIQEASVMIDGKNRWVCSDKAHVENYFGRTKATVWTGTVVMHEYGFLMCQIPKDGSTMLMMLLRRMMHKRDWNSTEYGLPHNPVKSGVIYASGVEDRFLKAMYDEPAFIAAAIVRHPIDRLLSGYLDKINDKKQYSRVGQLGEYVRKHGHPSFEQFVHFLIERHPNPERLDRHFKLQSVNCGMRYHKFDFVGSLGELGPEFKEFSQSMGLWEDYVADGWGQDGHQAFGEKSYQKHKHQSGGSIWKHYTEDLIWKVYAYYKEDFDRFGFGIEEILKTKPTLT